MDGNVVGFHLKRRPRANGTVQILHDYDTINAHAFANFTERGLHAFGQRHCANRDGDSGGDRMQKMITIG